MRTKLLCAFLSISILAAISGLIGNWILAICIALAAAVGGILVTNHVADRWNWITKHAEKIVNGDFDGGIDMYGTDENSALAAIFKKMAERQKEMAQALSEAARGRFNTSVKIHDEKDAIGKALQNCINNGRLLEQEIARIAEAAKQGRLRERANPDALQGAYNSLLNNINAILESTIRAPSKALKTLNKVMAGDLTARFSGDYLGDHKEFQDVINQTIQRMDDSFAQVGSAANRVSSATEQISAGGQALSQGASEQAASIEEVTGSLQEVSAMTRQNSDNAKEARNLTKIALSSVEAGVESMRRLSEAVNQIKASSDSTAKIVKTIDEIAFQTNLLALNAAVEAARAGDAGKGFAVVAEEVRNLSMRCAEAAKNTTSLIEQSVKNSENGVLFNGEVFKQFEEIKDHAYKVGVVMEDIVKASEQQTQAVEQVSNVISQMSSITQQFAANAEESASGSEQLFGLAEELKAMVYEFQLSQLGTSGSEDSTPMKPVPVKRDFKRKALGIASKTPVPQKHASFPSL